MDGSEWLTGETGRLIKAGIRGTTSGWTCTGKSGPALKELFEYVKGRYLNWKTCLSIWLCPKWHIQSGLWSKRLNSVTIKVQKGPIYNLSQIYQTAANKIFKFLYFVNDLNFANASMKIKQIACILICPSQKSIIWLQKTWNIVYSSYRLFFWNIYGAFLLFWKSAAQILIHFHFVYNHVILYKIIIILSFLP